MNEANRAVREAARDIVVEILGGPWNPTTRDGCAVRGGVGGSRHRTPPDTIRQRHLGAGHGEGNKPIAFLNGIRDFRHVTSRTVGCQQRQ